MKLPFRACSALVCLSGLVACSQTPAQTADDHTDVAYQSSTPTSEPAMTPSSSEPSAATPNTASKTAMGTTTDSNSKVPATGAHANDAHANDAHANDVRANDVRPASPAAAPVSAGTAPDNTKVNKRDTDSAALTPMDQGNGQTDLKITQQIRQAVMGDSSLSFTAKNVKIITVKGKVTLRGPVNTDAERSAIEAAARKVAGASVDNQIEVKK